MRMLIIFILWVPLLSHASIIEWPINQQYHLLSIDQQGVSGDQTELYSLALSSYSRSIGLASRFALSERWNANLGLLINDRSITLETLSSEHVFEDQVIDLNDLLSIKAKVEFAPVTPYLSFSWTYHNRDNSMTLNALSAFKLLTLDSVNVEFGQRLGRNLERYPQFTNQIKQSMLDGLEKYYIEPIFDVSFRYSFN